MKISIEGKDYDWDPDRITFAEAETIERTFGGTYRQWRLALNEGSATARRLLVWTLMRRDKTDLRLADLDGMTIDVAEVVPEPDEDENAEDPTGAPDDLSVSPSAA